MEVLHNNLLSNISVCIKVFLRCGLMWSRCVVEGHLYLWYTARLAVKNRHKNRKKTINITMRVDYVITITIVRHRFSWSTMVCDRVINSNRISLWPSTIFGISTPASTPISKLELTIFVMNCRNCDNLPLTYLDMWIYTLPYGLMGSCWVKVAASGSIWIDCLHFCRNCCRFL